MTLEALLSALASVDPAPLFALSLFPYLAFLWWARRSRRMPRLSLVGFSLTLLFVAVTIVAALLAETLYGRQLADVDPLHGGAESLLTLSNLLVLIGFRQAAIHPASESATEPATETASAAAPTDSSTADTSPAAGNRE